MDMRGDTVIVTGASSGIGAAAARRFARAGARLVLGARRKERLDAVAAEIEGEGGAVAIVEGDARDEAFAEALTAEARGTFGGLDAAFVNAGALGALGPIPEMSREAWRRVLETNLDAAFFAAKHAIPALRERGGGALLFTGSFVGQAVGLPGMGAYAASKAGLVGLTQVLAAEHGREGVRVNVLAPGGTRTEMAPDDGEALARIGGMHALQRLAAPEEIAETALFLLSKGASFITGATIVADGGNSIFKL